MRFESPMLWGYTFCSANINIHAYVNLCVATIGVCKFLWGCGAKEIFCWGLGQEHFVRELDELS